MKRFGKSTAKLEKRKTQVGKLKRMLAHLYQSQITLRSQIAEITDGDAIDINIPYDFHEDGWLHEQETQG